MSKFRPSPRAIRRRKYQSVAYHADRFATFAASIASAAIQASLAASADVQPDEWAAVHADLAALATLEESLVRVEGPVHWGLRRPVEGAEPAAAWGEQQYAAATARRDELGQQRDQAGQEAFASFVGEAVTLHQTRGRRSRAHQLCAAYPHALPWDRAVWQMFAA